MNKKNYPFQNLSLEDIPGENWKELAEIGESYLISNYGRIKSLPKYVEVFTPKNGRSICYWTKERIRKIKIHTKWNSIVEKPYYECTVSIRVDGVEKAFMIHRLVYSAFTLCWSSQKMKEPVVGVERGKSEVASPTT